MSEDSFNDAGSARLDAAGRPDLAPGQPATVTAEAAFGRCLALLRAGDPQAGALLQLCLERFPAFAAGWQELGSWLMEAGKPEAALVCLRRAAATAPSAPLALASGQALRALGRDREAAQDFAEACRLAPRSPRAVFLLGLCAQDGGDHAAARAAYERALALDPALPEAWTNLGIVRQALGDLAGARQAYGAALRGRATAFGRISQALAGAPKGELWLDLESLRRDLTG